MLRSVIFVVALMALIGWPSLSMPFRGDEALFAIVARECNQGAVLYRDYWDITNPGIFWFYRCGGTIFGFSEEGIRVFEWIYITSFVLIICERIRRTYHLPRLSPISAILIGGAYYFAGYSNTSHLTKTEGLAAFPLVLAMWLPIGERSSVCVSRKWLFIAGVCGGVAILFKLLFVVCLAACWGYWLTGRIRNEGWKSAITSTLTIAAGVFLVLGPAIAHFTWNGTFDLLTRTLVELPPQFLAEGERADAQRLALSVRWFLEQYSPNLALAILAGCASWRNRKSDVLKGFVCLIVSASAVILAQRLSWWSYHFMLLGGTISILAAYSWPALCEWVAARIRLPFTLAERVILSGASVILCLTAMTGGGNLVLKLAEHGFGWTADNREACRASIGNAYREAKVEAVWLKSVKPGRIYVCGNPLIYWFSDRLPAVPISGWSLQMYPTTIREEMTESVRIQKPIHVFVSTDVVGYEALIAVKYLELQKILREHYEVSRTSPNGKWYTLRDSFQSQ